MLNSFLSLQRDLEQDDGHSSDLVQKRNGTLLVKTVHKENGTKLQSKWCTISALSAALRMSAWPAAPKRWRKGCRSKSRRKKCGKIETYSDELVFSCSDKFLILEKSDCIQMSGDTHSSGETRKQDEKKLWIRRSVEFSSAAARCTPWRFDGHSNGETCRYKRGIRGCGSFRIWNWEWRRCNRETGFLWNRCGETLRTQSTSLPGKTKSWKDRMVTQSARVSSHNSSFGISILDRQEDPRTRTRWPCEWFGCEYVYPEHISEWRYSSSSSFWTRLWGEFVIREEYSLEQKRPAFPRNWKTDH